MNSREFTNVALQTLFWICHTLIVGSLASVIGEGWGILLRLFAVTLVNAITFYSFLNGIVPKYVESNRLNIFILQILILFTFVSVLRYGFEWAMPDVAPDVFKMRPLHIQFLIVILPTLFTAGAASLARLVLMRLDSEKKLANLALINAQTELKFLKAQINPHFLFNTLNNIYALAVEQSPQTAPILMQLSQLLRYLLYEGDAVKVPLRREIEMMQNMIALYALKYEETLNIEFQYPSQIEHIFVAPLIFINLLENAFKHSGIGDVPTAWMRLHFGLEQEHLYFSLQNSRLSVPTHTHQPRGIGLANLQRLLDWHYGEKYEMNLEPQPDVYSIVLKLPF